jgi:hypothetical protein
MKSQYHRSYIEFKEIKHGSNLAKLFNMAFESAETARMFSCPDLINEFDNDQERYRVVSNFYDLCQFDVYANSVIEKLLEWKELVNEYNTEFKGSWKYYASSKRIDSIKEWGGDDDDYNPDGSIKTNIPDKRLYYYGIIPYLISLDTRDIFMDYTIKHLETPIVAILLHGRNSILDIFSKMGTPMPTYRHENGELIKNDWTDELFEKANRNVSSDLLVDGLFSAVVAVRNLIDDVLKLKKTKDNKEFFLALPQRIDDILDLKIQKIIFPGKEAL